MERRTLRIRLIQALLSTVILFVSVFSGSAFAAELPPEGEIAETGVMPDREQEEEAVETVENISEEMDALVQAEEQAEEEEVFETVEVTSGQTDAPVQEEVESPDEPENKTAECRVEASTEEIIVQHRDNEDLFEQYANTLFYGTGTQPDGKTSKRAAKRTGTELSGQDAAAYAALQQAASEIASGQRSSAIVTIPLSDLGIDAERGYYKEDLGLEYIYKVVNGEGIWNPDIKQAVNSLLTLHAKDIVTRLWIDKPYEMYWQYGSISYPVGLGYRLNASYSGGSWNGVVHLTDVSVAFRMQVEIKYREDTADVYSVDRNKTGAASAAADYAKSIVAEADGMSDYDKLVHYKDRICSEVVYDHSAANNMGQEDRGPWTLIYVFDRDPDTNVVCEGYSEAFQYLCELTDFADSGICAYSVTGTLRGGTGAGSHKWNIVHMDDGRNYMADVTNSDKGNIGEDGRLFLKGVVGNVDDGYSLSRWNYTISYQYDSPTRSAFTDEELTLSDTDYGQAAGSNVDAAAKMESINLILTDKIGMRIHTALDRDIVTRDDFITFSYAGKTIRQTVGEADSSIDEKGRTVFELELATKQMTDDVTFYMTVGGIAGSKQTWSVRSYAHALLSSDSCTEEEKELVRAMLNYGSYTQMFSGYRTDSLAGEGIYSEADDPVMMEDPDLSAYQYAYTSGGEEGFRFKKASLILGTDVSIRFRFVPGAGKKVSDYDLILKDDRTGKTLQFDTEDDTDAGSVLLTHITPKELGTMFTLQAYRAGEAGSGKPEATITYGALSYCKMVLDSADTAGEIRNLCKSLYLYSQAADRLP